MVKENITEVRRRIADACIRAGRDPDSVTLIAVSKTKPIPMIEEAYESGSRDFGENKAQDMRDKHDAMESDIRWHFIGHLQTNKIKYVVGRAHMIHSVDSFHLAQAIEAECVKKDVYMPVLIEINVAGEESKFGVTPEETEALIREISVLPHLQVTGLMTIAPFVENAEENRQYFRKLHDLYIDIQSKSIDNVNMSVLSMGMTGDFEIAVEEGATHVRVGTGIFGERNYNKD